MTVYAAPVKEMLFVIREIADAQGIAGLPGYEDATDDVLEAVLEEAGKFANEVLAPLNQLGDQQGSRLIDGKVEVPEGFEQAYQQFIESGWVGIGQDPQYDGQGLPYLMASAVSEMWNAANLSFALNPMLTSSAIEALQVHGTDEIKAAYIAPLVSGEWCATMNLTEPQAGSDLSAVRTKATPKGDHYLIEGQKIYITWGEHPMSENILHLVLARLPDAPEGVKGISMFLVPKYLINADGSPGEINDLRAVSLEHKMGIHASPTCVMSFGDNGGAVGYLVGEENQGLANMFTMMNHARLGVGMQGVAIAERAYQQARDYALDRVQGYAPGSAERVAIIAHPDVRRMLMVMRGLTEASRALAYVAATSMDYARRSPDREQAAYHDRRVELLVPIVKGWCTEIAQEVASLGIQVHGGMGYIEETGAAQYFRDARIITIYEGTSGIQALDLAGRKVLRDQGRALSEALDEVAAFLTKLSEANAQLKTIKAQLAAGLDDARAAADWVLEHAARNPHHAGAVAFDLMMLLGIVLGGFQLARGARAAQIQLDNGADDIDFLTAKVTTAVFYAEHLLPRSKAHLAALRAGSESCMALAPDQF